MGTFRSPPIYRLKPLQENVITVYFSLTNCFNGFGVAKNILCRPDLVFAKERSAGWLSYNSSNPTLAIDELATLLTSGRMSSQKRNLITANCNFSKSDCLLKAEQLILSSPEFHSTGLVRSNGVERETKSTLGTCKPYKAIVHILLKGGCDSYNMLVPLSQCQGAGIGKLYTISFAN